MRRKKKKKKKKKKEEEGIGGIEFAYKCANVPAAMAAWADSASLSASFARRSRSSISAALRETTLSAARASAMRVSASR